MPPKCMKGINISYCNCNRYIQILINCPTFVLPCKYLFTCYNSQRFPITVNVKYIVIRIIVIRFRDKLKLPHSLWLCHVFFNLCSAVRFLGHSSKAYSRSRENPSVKATSCIAWMCSNTLSIFFHFSHTLCAPVHVHAAPTLFWFCNAFQGAIRTFAPEWRWNKGGNERLLSPNDQLQFS